MKIMPKNEKIERFRWIKPVLDKKISIKQMAQICPVSERTLKSWLKNYRAAGMHGLESDSRRPKSHPKETPIWIKERVIQLRKETRACAIKLKWLLEKDGIFIHERTIGKIIKNENLTRKYKVRRIKYRYVKAQLQPGWLVEIDVKYVPKKLNNKRYFQYTAIDVASRWRYIAVYDSQSNYNSICFLKDVIKRFPYEIMAIKTDNHSTFTNRANGYLKSRDPHNPRLHALDIFCQKQRIEHYLIDKGKPAQNGTVERSHRSDQETFYDRVYFATIQELNLKIRLWNMHYNDWVHCSLNGLTPNQFLHSSRGQYVRT
jgi:transposase InsO family protein